MKKYILLACVALAVLAFVFSRSSRSHDTEAAGLVVAPERDAPRVAGASVGESSAPSRSPSRQAYAGDVPSPALVQGEEEGREVLSMYDEIVMAFRQYRGNCRRMSESIDESVVVHTAALKRLQALSVAEKTALRERLQVEDGPRIAALGKEIEQAAALCKSSPDLWASLRNLATVGFQ